VSSVLDAPAAAASGVGRLQVVDSRGYYKDTELGTGNYPRVTTILGRNIPKNGLEYWAANEVAKTAMAELPMLAKAARTEEGAAQAYEWLRKGADRIKNERRDIGQAVHDSVEDRILGVPPRMRLDDAPDTEAFMVHFENFVVDYQVTFCASEMTVFHPGHRYAGTLDTLFTSPVLAAEFDIDPDTQILGDVKTGGQLDVKGIYTEFALQGAAYTHATWAQLRDGTHVRMPPLADRMVVLHLRPEGIRVIPVDVGPQVFGAFLALLEHDRTWTTGLAKKVLGKHVPAPAPAGV
jgi:hypothetical protein